MQNELLALQAQYAEAINTAVAEGRDDIVAELAADYPDAALRVLADPAHQRAA